MQESNSEKIVNMGVYRATHGIPSGAAIPEDFRVQPYTENQRELLNNHIKSSLIPLEKTLSLMKSLKVAIERHIEMIEEIPGNNAVTSEESLAWMKEGEEKIKEMEEFVTKGNALLADENAKKEDLIQYCDALLECCIRLKI